MAVKVTGQFEPAGSFAIVDGKDVSGAITGSSITATANISGSAASTGSFGHIMVGGGNFTSTSLASGGGGGTTVAANPGTSGSGNLTTITISGDSYALGTGGGLENIFETDGLGDLMPATVADPISVFYELDGNSDIQPRT
jgi:hypothetical protein